MDSGSDGKWKIDNLGQDRAVRLCHVGLGRARVSFMVTRMGCE